MKECLVPSAKSATNIMPPGLTTNSHFEDILVRIITFFNCFFLCVCVCVLMYILDKTFRIYILVCLIEEKVSLNIKHSYYYSINEVTYTSLFCTRF